MAARSPLLSEEEVQFYQKNGYLLYKKQLFQEDKLKVLKAISDEHFTNRGTKRGDELDTPHFHDERLLDFLLSDEVLDLVEPLTGPNIALWSSAFLIKEPYIGRPTPWHEDSAYWKGRIDGYDIVTIWLALERSSKENGCMRVIPGTHMNGFSEYEEIDGTIHTFSSQIKQVNEAQAVYFELEKGECSLHDARIMHGAMANTSPMHRYGYTMRYFPTSIKFHDDLPRNKDFRIWLARGKDLAGNKYANL
jgi:ectoine hydroxylase-related dioxygenase (phytanoyl-CoA dioxygenase family)